MCSLGTLKLMLPCKDLRGDALMVARHGTWDHTFDFSFSVQWEAKVRGGFAWPTILALFWLKFVG